MATGIARRMVWLFGAGLVALDWTAGGLVAWIFLDWWRAGEVTDEILVLLGMGALVVAVVRTALVVSVVRYRPGRRR